MKPELPIGAVAANIVYGREVGEEREQRPGTKHFAGGSKVYIVTTHWRERIEVIGMARTSHRWIRVWTRPSYLANVRVEMVYSPKVAALLNAAPGNTLDGSEANQKRAERIATSCGATTQHFRHELRPHNSP